jgi:hypothetical protein
VSGNAIKNSGRKPLNTRGQITNTQLIVAIIKEFRGGKRE